MKKYIHIVILCLIAATASAASLEDKIITEALIVTKAELRRHMAAPENDAWRPASYVDLAASRGDMEPDYLVVRLRTSVPGHYYGEAEAKIDGAKAGTKLNITLHYNQGWVEYFIPLDGLSWPITKDGKPSVILTWNRLETK
ncbi:MAG TPA: hypothetical protein PKK58_07270 [Opitutaceae bacterium]|nr:hypothetical protein [Opitutaceae bacterium]HQL21010.1 hypothetical protein [Opitutaceae bacterium]